MLADKGSSEGQAIVGQMKDNGIGTPMDLIPAIRYYDLSSN
jgi:TPR repeat protein